MKYPAQSDIWRLDRIVGTKPIANSGGQSRVLARFQQVFPLALFPDELIVEELRIIWIQKNGPWTNNVISIMATDIACVNASTGPFFGHVHIQSLTGGPEILIEQLLRKDAFKIRSLVEGIALAAREGLKIEHGSLEAERENLLKAGGLKLA
ncbi:hypothetical protein HYU92_01965 [Candidatus Curtissbacteria bacterium]|nr:hypothetical protein [Candidatus Curtissbacteria bacterium]